MKPFNRNIMSKSSQQYLLDLWIVLYFSLYLIHVNTTTQWVKQNTFPVLFGSLKFLFCLFFSNTALNSEREGYLIEYISNLYGSITRNMHNVSHPPFALHQPCRCSFSQLEKNCRCFISKPQPGMQCSNLRLWKFAFWRCSSNTFYTRVEANLVCRWMRLPFCLKNNLISVDRCG